MIVRTQNSVYEVQAETRQFRRLSAGKATGRDPEAWSAYSMVGPIEPGQPMRFFRAGEDRGRASRFGIVVTTPVVEVLDENPTAAA